MLPKTKNDPGARQRGARKHETRAMMEEKLRQSKQQFLKQLLKFLFSNIGLCVMVIAYSVAGGFIFQHLERTNEKQECITSMEKYEPLRNTTRNNLWQISSNFRQDDDVEFALLEFKRQLAKFRHDVLDLGYDGTNCTQIGQPDGRDYAWSFSGSLLFAVTVISTIGYGNIAPKTFWGRLVCIAYATLGIPLMLLCLSNIGSIMADIFRFVYTKVFCFGFCRRKQRDRQGDSKRDPQSPEDWKNNYGSNKQSRGPKILDDDDDDEYDEEEKTIGVPLTITMCVIFGYVAMGAVLFGIWESWDPLEASYFCFVTISTIGFGDLVPGAADFKSAKDQAKMLGAAFYMLFGMSILSMCFSLIQQEMVAKFRWIGEKMGIFEKEKDEEDGDDDQDDKAKIQDKNDENPPEGTGRPKHVSAHHSARPAAMPHNHMGAPAPAPIHGRPATMARVRPGSQHTQGSPKPGQTNQPPPYQSHIPTQPKHRKIIVA